jgi:hypothetical protein
VAVGFPRFPAQADAAEPRAKATLSLATTNLRPNDDDLSLAILEENEQGSVRAR